MSEPLLTGNLRKPQTSVEYAYHAIRDAIVRGALAAGDRIPLSDWAQRLGTSAMPVREAMRRLETEGLVDFLPHKGATVVGLSAQAGLDVYELRMLVEPLLVPAAVAAFDDERRERALALCDRMDNAENSSQFAELNQEFHTLMLHVPPSWTARVVDLLRTAAAAYVASSLQEDASRQRSSNQEHRALVQAFTDRDVERVKQITIDHLETTRVILLERAAQETT